MFSTLHGPYRHLLLQRHPANAFQEEAASSTFAWRWSVLNADISRCDKFSGNSKACAKKGLFPLVLLRLAPLVAD